jgi:hypothetical protein
MSGIGAMNFRPPFPARLPDPDAVGYPQAVEAYLARLRSFYNARAAWHRRFYRFTGIMVILIGAALPLVATLTYPHKDLVLSILGVTIAAFTALRAFYRWDQSWVLLRNTEMAITSAWWDYHAKVSAIPSGDGVDEQFRHGQRCDAARLLAQLLLDIRKQEAEFFFKDMKFPAGKEDS